MSLPNERTSELPYLLHEYVPDEFRLLYALYVPGPRLESVPLKPLRGGSKRVAPDDLNLESAYTPLLSMDAFSMDYVPGPGLPERPVLMLVCGRSEYASFFSCKLCEGCYAPGPGTALSPLMLFSSTFLYAPRPMPKLKP